MPPGKKVVHLSRIQDGARSLWQRAGGRRSTTTADHVADDGASEFPVDSLVESSFLSRDDSVENSRVVPSSPSASSPNESFQSEAAVWRQKKPSVRDGGRDDPELGTIPIHFAPDESGEGSSMIVAAPLRGSSLNDDSHNTSMDAVMAGKRPRRVTSPSRGRSSGGLRMWRAQSSDEHPLDEPKTTLAESGLLASTLVYVPSTDDATWLEVRGTDQAFGPVLLFCRLLIFAVFKMLDSTMHRLYPNSSTRTRSTHLLLHPPYHPAASFRSRRCPSPLLAATS
jgi:hypothetical protein